MLVIMSELSNKYAFDLPFLSKTAPKEFAWVGIKYEFGL
jgi:hypothetical protein